MAMQLVTSPGSVVSNQFFIRSPHQARYYAFILSRPKRDLKKAPGYNIHHVVPKCFGGSNEPKNLIKLTLREHYIAHLILWKGCGGKMAYAFKRMTFCQCTDQTLTSRQFVSLHNETKPSEETRQKISERLKGRRLSEETKKKISERRAGWKLSNETRQKISKSGTGKKHSAKTKQAISESLTGIKRSEDTKQMLSNLRRGKKHSETRNQNFSKAMCGRRWYTDGKINKRCYEAPGPEFTLGRTQP